MGENNFNRRDFLGMFGAAFLAGSKTPAFADEGEATESGDAEDVRRDATESTRKSAETERYEKFALLVEKGSRGRWIDYGGRPGGETWVPIPVSDISTYLNENPKNILTAIHSHPQASVYAARGEIGVDPNEPPYPAPPSINDAFNAVEFLYRVNDTSGRLHWEVLDVTGAWDYTPDLGHPFVKKLVAEAELIGPDLPEDIKDEAFRFYQVSNKPGLLNQSPLLQLRYLAKNLQYLSPTLRAFVEGAKNRGIGAALESPAWKQLEDAGGLALHDFRQPDVRADLIGAFKNAGITLSYTPFAPQQSARR